MIHTDGKPTIAHRPRVGTFARWLRTVDDATLNAVLRAVAGTREASDRIWLIIAERERRASARVATSPVPSGYPFHV